MLVWVDVETSGLETRGNSLLEVGMIVTENNLEEVARTSVVLKPPDHWKLTFKPEIIEMHTKGEGNGLMTDCVVNGVARDEAMFALVRFLAEHVPHLDGDPPVMAGNSVHFDRMWLKAKMPLLEECFHYRNLDVSSLKIFNRMAEFAEPWEGDRKIHRALPDLEDSIAELRHYWEAINEALEDAAVGIDISEIGGTLP